MNLFPKHLQLRRATVADMERLSVFNGIVHGQPNQPSRTIAARSRSWLDGSHPVVSPTDWTVVEELTTSDRLFRAPTHNRPPSL